MFLIKILVDYNKEIIKSTNLYNTFFSFVALLIYRILRKLKISMIMQCKVNEDRFKQN